MAAVVLIAAVAMALIWGHLAREDNRKHPKAKP